ncbi:DUF6787 family protein [Filimonas effusa]|uniref:DUF6787 family protein n=1 Tax=Filimonas effusa TaxID=2508721 RepID=UPI0038B3A482
MFKHLKQKWNVNGWRLLLIITTFALGGSACGYIGRLIMKTLPIEHRALWLIIYILLVSLLWPLCVLIVSIPLGQFLFFRQYLARLFSRKRRTDKK